MSREEGGDFWQKAYFCLLGHYLCINQLAAFTTGSLPNSSWIVSLDAEAADTIRLRQRHFLISSFLFFFPFFPTF